MTKKPILIFLSSIAFSILLLSSISQAANVTIEAHKQTFDEKSNMTTFDGNVKVGIDNIKIKSPKALVKNGADGKPETAHFINGAYAIKNDGTSQSEVKANIIHLTLLDKRIVADGNAKSMISENKHPIITIKAVNQEFDSVNNTIKANGNVIMNYKDIATNSSTALINITPDGKPSKVTLTGSVKVVDGKNVINSNHVIYDPNTNEMTATGNVKSKTMLDDGTPVLITSENQEYNKETNTMLSSGKVKVIYKDYVAFGPKATILSDNGATQPNRIIFIGRSNIKEGTRQVEGDKIEIIMNPKNFNAEGNVKTRFIQEETADNTANNDKKTKNKKIKAKKKKAIAKSNVKSIDADLSNGASFDKNFKSGMQTENVPDLKEEEARVNKSTNFSTLSNETPVSNKNK